MTHNYFIRRILPAILLLFCAPALCAKGKLYTSQYGRAYLQSGETVIAEGENRIVIPKKKEKLLINEKAYTHESKIGRKIDPLEIDSVVVWSPSAPERPHTLRFIPDYGWCWQLESGPRISIYAYSPKGYYFGGNGGGWVRGKGRLILVKDGVAYDCGRHDKNINNALRRKLAPLVADDPKLSEYILNVKGRRDKKLRVLSTYPSDNL
ncbi:MAG: hypothetical protein HDS65_03585 [Bacteroidales bacterium]|nr:hypothetical protein [Bacteroidales bacterium]